MFIEKLQRLVAERDLTMNKLAQNAGFSQANTDRWKKGSMPNTDALIKICKYLNVSADYLLDLDETPPPPCLSDQEQRLLEYYRRCKPDIQRSIMILASSGAEEATTQETPQKSSNLKNIG